jgi:hypothetical protein
VNGSARRVVGSIPTGFRLKAQGCEARATLGQRPIRRPNRSAVAAIPIATISHQHRQNPVGVSRDERSITQGSSATLGWRPESPWDSLNLTASAHSTFRVTHRASGRISYPVEFDGIKNSAKRHFAWSTV